MYCTIFRSVTQLLFVESSCIRFSSYHIFFLIKQKEKNKLDGIAHANYIEHSLIEEKQSLPNSNHSLLELSDFVKRKEKKNTEKK